jgi:hypothetical protein
MLTVLLVFLTEIIVLTVRIFSELDLTVLIFLTEIVLTVCRSIPLLNTEAGVP